MKLLSSKYLGLIILFSGLFFIGCRHWDNFTTYFNTYYNAERLIAEAEDEFEYQDEKRRIKPRVFVPEPKMFIRDKQKRGVPAFVRDYVISQQKRQPVNIKLDSVIIKGSKILAYHPKSYYVQGTLFLMAKAYFYRNEWLPSQIKCSELIDKYPGGEFSPDAHLLMAKNLLIQRKFYSGKILLSRTVDIAWQLRRYDILSEAFRLEAEVALYEDDLEGALRPYRQAIAQSDDGAMSARWQLDMALLLYRMSKFARAEAELVKVHDFSPDYMAEYEAYLYQAACLNRMGKYGLASEILYDLENDGKYEEWKGYAFAERMNALLLQDKPEEMLMAEEYADTTFVNNPLIIAYYFSRAMKLYEDDKYFRAGKYFGRSRTVRTPVFKTSHKMYKLLNEYDRNYSRVSPLFDKYEKGGQLDDSTSSELAYYTFNIGRIHEQLENNDSALYYYKLAAEFTPLSNDQSARYLYSYARTVRDSDPYLADSLLEVVVDQFPLSEYGQDAISILGFTDEFVIDTVAELYKSGSDLRRFGDYNFAIIQFKEVYTRFPKTDYAPKALYAIGWIYEKNLYLTDSALYFYDMLIKKYPRSEYARDIQLSLNYYKIVLSGEPIPDSLKTRTKIASTKPKRKNRFVQDTEQQPNQLVPGNMGNQFVNPMDLINNPSDIINSAKESLSNPQKLLDTPENFIESIDIPTNLLDFFSSPDEKDKEDEKNIEKDSTKTKNPEKPK